MGLSQSANLAIVAVMAALAVLCLLGLLWFRAYLRSGLAPLFLVQHALWHGAIAGVRIVSRVPVPGPALAQAQRDALRGAAELVADGSQQRRAFTRPAPGVSGGYGQCANPRGF